MKYAKLIKRLIGAFVVAGMMAGVGAAGSANAATVLITGSNRGLGFAFAKSYAEKGWTVIATTRNPGDDADLDALAAKYKNVAIEKLDVTDEAGITALAAKYKGKPIDLLINNAAINDAAGKGAVLGEFDAKLFEREMRTNVLGPLLVNQAFLENVVASDMKKIVAITSPSAVLGRPMNKETRRAHTYFYRPSKSALNMAMKILAAEVRERGVIVGIIHPGGVDTEMLRSVYGGKPTPGAQTADQSAAGIVKVIEGLTQANSDQVTGFDGKPIPW
ncbi:MAG: SDR family oxidoreductase [Rhodospirillaceae bacterium]|nr:SDR family oxidoreductase [Rhodospirillaceae bacterium]